MKIEFIFTFLVKGDNNFYNKKKTINTWSVFWSESVEQILIFLISIKFKTDNLKTIGHTT